MLSLESLVVLILIISASEAIPRRDRRDLEDRGMVDEVIGVTDTLSTDYRTMPPGTYTETISTGLVKIIVVNKPTPTTTSKGNCPEECDCTRIKDKESPE